MTYFVLEYWIDSPLGKKPYRLVIVRNKVNNVKPLIVVFYQFTKHRPLVCSSVLGWRDERHEGICEKALRKNDIS